MLPVIFDLERLPPPVAKALQDLATAVESGWQRDHEPDGRHGVVEADGLVLRPVAGAPSQHGWWAQVGGEPRPGENLGSFLLGVGDIPADPGAADVAPIVGKQIILRIIPDAGASGWKAFLDSGLEVTGAFNQSGGNATFNTLIFGTATSTVGGTLTVLGTSSMSTLGLTTLNVIGRANLNGQARAHRTRATNQTISDSTVTIVEHTASGFTAIDVDLDTPTAGRITVPRGTYACTAGVRWATNTTGARSLQLRVDAATAFEVQQSGDIPNASYPQVIAGLVWANVDDTVIDVRVFQTSGGDLDLIGNATTTWFTLSKVA